MLANSVSCGISNFGFSPCIATSTRGIPVVLADPLDSCLVTELECGVLSTCESVDGA